MSTDSYGEGAVVKVRCEACGSARVAHFRYDSADFLGEPGGGVLTRCNPDDVYDKWDLGAGDDPDVSAIICFNCGILYKKP